MSRTDHGFDMTVPVLQPKSSRFAITSAGFDTGERTFVVDSAHFERVKPLRDTPDTKISWRNTDGIQYGTHARMFVDTVDILSETNGLTRYTVRYLGMIGRTKPGKITKDTELGQFRSRVSSRVIALGNAFMTTYESTPTVTHVYLSLTEPATHQVGAKMAPPSSNPASEQQLKNFRPYISGVRANDDILFEGWVLRSRASQQCGSIHEVTDVHSYERVREEA